MAKTNREREKVRKKSSLLNRFYLPGLKKKLHLSNHTETRRRKMKEKPI